MSKTYIKHFEYFEDAYLRMAMKNRQNDGTQYCLIPSPEFNGETGYSVVDYRTASEIVEDTNGHFLTGSEMYVPINPFTDK